MHDPSYSSDQSAEFEEEEILGESQAQSGPSNSSSQSEIELYISASFNKAALESVDPIDFWKNMSSVLPNLTQLAKKIFCVPASSAGIERSFSRLKYVVDDLRLSMRKENVSKLLISETLNDL
jgi:hypothetical protein